MSTYQIEARVSIGDGTMTARERLADHIRQHGPIRTVRVSSAQARGAAKRYTYWGAVRYEIRLGARDGMPHSIATERASSDRRSLRLAESDGDRIAVAESRIWWSGRGALSEQDCELILGVCLGRSIEAASQCMREDGDGEGR